MGLNVVDDPTNWKYADKAELQILDLAIDSLLDYQMIEKDSYGNILLTHNGEHSIVEGRKYKRSKETKTIYFDVLSGNDSLAATVFPKLANRAMEVEIDDRIGVVDDKRVYDCLLSLHSELFDEERGSSVESIHTHSLKLYKAEIPFEVIYDFSSLSYEVLPTVDIKELDEMSDDSVFCHTVLTKYFSGVKEAVIYKPNVQLNLERDDNDNKLFERMVYGKKEYMAHLLNTIDGNCLGVCLYFKTLDDSLFNQIDSVAEKKENTLFFVEYTGDDRFNGYSNKKNVGVVRKDELSITDVCVCSNDTYFKEELFVFSFEGKDYQIPVVVKHNEKRYRFPILARPFISSMIEELVDDFAAKTEYNNDIVEVEEVRKLSKRKDFLSTVISTSANIDETIMERIDQIWHSYLNNIIQCLSNEVESIKMSNLPLVLSEKFLNKTNELKTLIANNDNDKIDMITEIQERLHYGPKVFKRNAYIIDTSCLIDDPQMLNSFDIVKDIVYIPKRIWEELDTISHEDTSRGTSAKKAINNVNRISTERPQFLKIDSVSREEMEFLLPSGWDTNKTDNHLLALALKIKRADEHKSITIIVRDKAFEHKAILEGIDVRRER